MENCKLAPTQIVTSIKLRKNDEGSDVNPNLFKRLFEKLMCLTTTMLDIIQGVGFISRFTETPKESYWIEDNLILRYIEGSTYYGIMYASTKKKDLIGYTDSDFEGRLDDRKRTYVYVFHLG